MYAYEQIEIERVRRFGHAADRKLHFEYLLKDALKDDEVIELVPRTRPSRSEHRQCLGRRKS